jgi:hypothetical protein
MRILSDKHPRHTCYSDPEIKPQQKSMGKQWLCTDCASGWMIGASGERSDTWSDTCWLPGRHGCRSHTGRECDPGTDHVLLYIIVIIFKLLYLNNANWSLTVEPNSIALTYILLELYIASYYPKVVTVSNYMCDFVCVRACVRACVCACVHACVRTCIHACIHACMRACMCVCAHACANCPCSDKQHFTGKY